MGTSQNLPAAVRVVRRERGFVGDDLGTRHGVMPRADFECLALSFDRFGAGTSVGFGAEMFRGCHGHAAALGRYILCYAVSGCVADV